MVELEREVTHLQVYRQWVLNFRGSLQREFSITVSCQGFSYLSEVGARGLLNLGGGGETFGSSK